MNFALHLAIAGLAFSAARVLATSPAAATAIWMLFVWRTPPRSDLFDSPLRRRLRVVSLLPKACRKANGNSAASNGRSASADMASSISTAFIPPLTARFSRPRRKPHHQRSPRHQPGRLAPSSGSGLPGERIRLCAIVRLNELKFCCFGRWPAWARRRQPGRSRTRSARHPAHSAQMPEPQRDLK